MRIPPNWPAAVALYMVYNLIIFVTWWQVGANYADLTSAGVALRSLDLPLGLGALFTAVAVTYLGWWRPVLLEPDRPSLRWPLWLVIAAMGGFVAIHAVGAHWSSLSAAHIGMLVAAGLLVGFNEELVTRGVLVTGVRAASRKEVWAWFWASVLFGAMHVPNALFGIPLVASLIQGVFAFLMGGAFYVLRRLSGTIVLPMILHGAWDFVSFSSKASGAAIPLAPYFQFGTYAIAIVAVVSLFRATRSASRSR